MYDVQDGEQLLLSGDRKKSVRIVPLCQVTQIFQTPSDFAKINLMLDHPICVWRLSRITRVVFSSYERTRSEYKATYIAESHYQKHHPGQLYVPICRSSSCHGSRTRGPRDDGFKVVYALDHSSESPAEL